MRIVLGVLFVIGVILAVSLLTLLGVSAIRRGRGKHGTSGALGAGLLEVQSLLEPSKRHVLEADRRESESTAEDTSGDPPK